MRFEPRLSCWEARALSMALRPSWQKKIKYTQKRKSEWMRLLACHCFFSFFKSEFTSHICHYLFTLTLEWALEKHINLIVATCWSRPMWEMVIECLLDTFWPDPPKDLRSLRLPLPGGGCYGLGTPWMVQLDQDSKSMWKSYIPSNFWLHKKSDLLAKKSPNTLTS